MRNSLLLLLIFVCLGCSTSTEEETQGQCLNQRFSESFEILPGQCVSFADKPDLFFQFEMLEPDEKTHYLPVARVGATIAREDWSWTFYTGMVYEDVESEGIQFSGPVHTGWNEERYTIFFEDIEFTETATHYIFHKARIHFKPYDEEEYGPFMILAVN